VSIAIRDYLLDAKLRSSYLSICARATFLADNDDLHPKNWSKTNVKNLLEFGPPQSRRDHEKIEVH
jgi:hypothetical protein